MNIEQRLYIIWLIMSLVFTCIVGYFFYTNTTPDNAMLLMMGTGWCMTALAGIV